MTSVLDQPPLATTFAPTRPSPADDHALRRLLWRSALLLVALAGAWLGVGHWRGGVQMREFQRLAAAKQAEFDSRPTLRSALWGEARAESAWPYYEKAVADVAKLDAPLVARLCRIAAAPLSGKPLREPPAQKPPAQSAEQVLAAHALALDELRSGARAADGRRPMTWSAGFSHRISNLLTARTVCNLAVLDAHRAISAGHGSEAVHRLLDALQMGRDFMQAPILIEQMIGCALLSIAGYEGIALVDLWRHVDAAAIAVLAEGLARLDASLPLDSKWLASEAVLFANHLAHFAGRSAVPALWGPGVSQIALSLQAWRYGCSLTLAAANHGLAHLAAGERMAALAGSGQSLDMAEVTRLHDGLIATRNPISLMATPNLASGMRNRLMAIAQVRLLRMACQHALGAAVTPLPDPQGGTLRFDVDMSGTATFWSDAQRKNTEFTMRR